MRRLQLVHSLKYMPIHTCGHFVSTNYKLNHSPSKMHLHVKAVCVCVKVAAARTKVCWGSNYSIDVKCHVPIYK